MQEQEYHFHQGKPVRHRNVFMIPQPPNDEASRAHHYEADQVWTVEVYDKRLSSSLQGQGATEKPCSHDGKLFVVDARQLIEFVAESSGLIVEFPKRKRPQLTEEQRQAKRLRMAAINAQKDDALSSMNNRFSLPDSQETTRADVFDVGGVR